MNEKIYERLREHLDSLPTGYPKTQSGVELKILRKLFTEEEAEMACQLKPLQESLEAALEVKPYDELRKIIEAQKTIALADCICRKKSSLLDHPCSKPLESCFAFGAMGEYYIENGLGRRVTKEEALSVLQRNEEAGLVPSPANAQKTGGMCNCCGCCCGILRPINEWGIENSIAHANYTATIDPTQCLNCGTCRTRCQVHAITQQNDVAVVNKQKCIGCGLCATGCPNNAAQLKRKPQKEIINPPENFATWEHERLHNRGLTK
jgi:electron transport complex protein RnfB